ncbi:MAG: hypothetical protein LBT05_16235 [Planctomycetaceae bacterium]|jgi:hypothetical protein|nr:hypothetical protein [Planctomycetaceae bacterium]
MNKKISIVLFFVLTILFLYFVNFISNGFIFAEKAPPNPTSRSNPEMAGESNELRLNNLQNTEIKSNNTLTREGTIVQSQHVWFRMVGNRVMMSSVQDSSYFLCLENLNLERIVNMMRKYPTMTDWQVDYLVTEYRGENYAIIQRAALMSSINRTKDTK